jgi:aarF domain-containing kinase
MEFCEGTKISERQSLLQQGINLADVDSKMIKAFAEQIFHTGFVHADPHPGNSKQQSLSLLTFINFL